MNLLEHFKQNLKGPTKTLAIQLLRKPWNADLQTLCMHVPKPLYDRFAILRNDVLIKLDRINSKSLPHFWIGVDQVALEQNGLKINGIKGVIGGQDTHWVDQIWSQIIEDLDEGGSASSALDEKDRAALILLYTVAHACFFSLVRVVDLADQSQHNFSLVHTPDAARAHRLYWFAHYLSSQSMMSDHLFIYMILESAKKAGRPMHVAFHASSDTLASCRDYFTDKFLSLHPDYIHLLHDKDQSAINAMSERLELIIHIYLCSVRQQLNAGELNAAIRFDRLLAVEISTEDLCRAGFNDKAIRELVDECMRHPIGDRFFVEVDKGRLQMGDISLKYAMQMHCHAMLTRIDSRGKWFEQDYIANYIRERIPANRYRVFPGINDKVEKYDADVIIEDIRTGALLFCQVKHRTTTLLAHLRDEMREYMGGKGQIEHGLAQLHNLRDQIGSDGVLMRVKQRTGHYKLTSESLTDRARYLLIHNIENLDFCTSDGIAMYEWNTLRNLMKNTMSTVTKEGSTTVFTSAEDINLDDPHQVMEALWNWMEASMPKGQTPSVHWEVLRASRLMFLSKSSLYFKRFRTIPCGTFAFSFPVI